jgi:hypothetical protein
MLHPFHRKRYSHLSSANMLSSQTACEIHEPRRLAMARATSARTKLPARTVPGGKPLPKGSVHVDAPAKKSPAKKATAVKKTAPTKKAAAKKSPAKKAAKKSAAKKAPAPAKKAAAPKKAPAAKKTAAKKAPASPTKSKPMGLGGFAAGKLGRNNSLDAGLAALDAALASNAEV